MIIRPSQQDEEIIDIKKALVNYKRNGRGGTKVKFDSMHHHRGCKLSRVTLLRKYTYSGNTLVLIVK